VLDPLARIYTQQGDLQIGLRLDDGIEFILKNQTSIELSVLLRQAFADK
jgi:hypothetical protein